MLIEELSGMGRWPCKRGPEFGHLKPIKTRDTVKDSVIPARVPRDKEMETELQALRPTNLAHTVEKTARRPGLQKGGYEG